MLRDKCNCKGIFVCSEVRSENIHSVTYELIGKARELADKKGTIVYAAVLYDCLKMDPSDLISYGADKVLLIQDQRLKHFNQEITANILKHLIYIYKPEIVLAPATSSGRTYLPSVAAAFKTGLTADCTSLDIDMENGLLIQTRPAIGGNIMASIKTPMSVPQMSTVRPKTFRIPEATRRNGEILSVQVPGEMFNSRIRTLSMEYSKDDTANIQDKEVIIAGGKGLRKAKNFALLEKLANLLSGGVGASRPTVEDKWISFPHQVGLSGKIVAPKFYLAAGISGAVQHLAGMKTAQKIVAVNKDPNAPIFKISDIALCGDLSDIIPRLIDRIAKEIETK